MVDGETDKLAAGLGEVVIVRSQPITEIVTKTREQSPDDVNSKLLRRNNRYLVLVISTESENV